MSALTPTMLTMASGRAVDLLNPTAADIDFADIAEHLAKEPRFNGATPGVIYSVGQHLVIGCDELAGRPWKPSPLAGWFLLHDAPEGVLKDDTTPKKKALARLAEAEFGVLSATIMRAFDALTERWDAAFAEAAGFAWPPPREIAAAVKRMDRRMLVTEWRDLMRHEPMPPGYEDAEPLDRTILPWDWRLAKATLLDRFHRHLPALARRA